MDEMIKRLIICFIILVCMSLTTGCWDEREINDQAIILGWGFDQNEDGDYIGSAQIVVPGEVGEKSSGQGKGYMVETATGKVFWMFLRICKESFQGKFFKVIRRSL